MHVIAAVIAAAVLAPQAKPAGGRAHRSEEIESQLQKTGFVLPRMAFEADLSLSRLEFDEFRRAPGDPDVTFDQVRAELAVGATDWLTAEVELPLLWLDVDPGSSENGIGDIAVEAKASLRSGPANPLGFIPDLDVAPGLRITFPTGDEDDGTGEENATFSPFVAGSYVFDGWLAVHARLLTEWQQDRRPVHRVNTTAEFSPWAPEFSLFAGLQIEREGSDSAAALFLPGVEYRFPQIPLTPGLSVPLGLSKRAPDWGIILNVQYRF